METSLSLCAYHLAVSLYFQEYVSENNSGSLLGNAMYMYQTLTLYLLLLLMALCIVVLMSRRQRLESSVCDLTVLVVIVGIEVRSRWVTLSQKYFSEQYQTPT